jgi:ABC-2 type transport system permease protein
MVARKYYEIARINFLNCLTYPMNMLSRSLLMCLRIWIMCQLYEASFTSQSSVRVGGLTLAMVIWCIVFTQSFQAACQARPLLPTIIDEEVKSGILAYTLNKPYSYLLFNYFGFLGRSLPNFFLNLLLGSATAFLLTGPLHVELRAVPAAALMSLVGFTLHFCISISIGLSAFWIEDTSAFNWLYHKGQLVLGGLILPIALFPESIRYVVEYLPFSQLFYAPARVLVAFDAHLFALYLTAQIAWTVVFALLVTLLFASGSRNVSINGG